MVVLPLFALRGLRRLLLDIDQGYHALPAVSIEEQLFFSTQKMFGFVAFFRVGRAGAAGGK